MGRQQAKIDKAQGYMYFKRLYQENERMGDTDEELGNSRDTEANPLTFEQLMKSVRRPKNWKAPELDEIQSDLMKWCGEELLLLQLG